MTIEAVELDGKKVKEKGWETTFTIMVDQIADEKLRKQILKKKQGADFDFNIYTLEKDRDEAFVKKYFLNLDENEEKEIGQEFSGKIKEVKRLLLAEMNEEFFTSNFGDKATDEKTAKEFIREQLSLFYSNEAMQLVYRDVMDKMMNTTKLDLPVSFLEKWLKSQDKNKDLPEIELKNQLETFLKEMRWSLIKSQLSEKYEIDVTEEEVKQRLYSKAQQYMTSQMQGFSDPTMLNQIFEYLAKDQNQVNQSADEVATDKVFGKLKDIVTLEDKKVSLEEFKDIVKALNQQIEAEKNAQ
jgi:trigger factor